MNPCDEQDSVQEICDELSQFSLVDALTLEGDDDVSIGSFSLVLSEEGYEVVSEYAAAPAMQFLSATGLEPSEEGERLAGRYLETAEGDVDLAVGLYFDSDPQSLVAPNEADADTTKKPPAIDADVDMDKKPAATKVGCHQKADSEGWPSVVYLDEFVRTTGLEATEESRRLARAYLTATDCNVDLAVHLYLEEAQSLDGSVSELETHTGDAMAESMEQPAGEEVVTKKEYKDPKDHACSSLEDLEVASIRQSRWQETKTGLESLREDGLLAKPSSQSNSAFIEPGPIRAWRKLVDREKEFEKELEGAADVPSTTCNRYGCCSIPGETCGRNGIPSNGSCILMHPSGCRHFGPDYYPYAPSKRKHFARKLGLERPRLSRDIDDMNEFKKRRPANYSIPSPKEADADSSDGSEVSSLDNASVGGHWPGR